MQGPRLLGLLGLMVIPPPPMAPPPQARITPDPRARLILSTGPLLDTPNTVPRPEVTTMVPHLQEPRAMPQVPAQLQGLLPHTRDLMGHQDLDPRDRRQIGPWVIRPRALHLELPNPDPPGHHQGQVDQPQEPLEVHQEDRLPLALLTIPEDLDQTTFRSWRIPSRKWRRKGCKETRDTTRPGDCTSPSHLALTVLEVIPRQEVPRAQPLASTRVS